MIELFVRFIHLPGMDESVNVLEILKSDDSTALEEYCASTFDFDEIVGRPTECEHPELFNSGPSMLSAACYFRSYECTRFLIGQSADISIKDKMGRQPILFAVAGGSLQIIQMLTENGALLDSCDNAGNGVVHYIVTYQRRALLVWFAFTNSLSLSPRNNRRITPLHLAATAQLSDYIKILCENGADVDAKTDRGATPLHYACAKPCLKSVELLHKWGANLSAKDNGGLQPYHWAGTMKRKEIQTYLIENGAQVRDYC